MVPPVGGGQHHRAGGAPADPGGAVGAEGDQPVAVDHHRHRRALHQPPHLGGDAETFEVDRDDDVIQLCRRDFEDIGVLQGDHPVPHPRGDVERVARGELAGPRRLAVDIGTTQAPAVPVDQRAIVQPGRRARDFAGHGQRLAGDAGGPIARCVFAMSLCWG